MIHLCYSNHTEELLAALAETLAAARGAAGATLFQPTYLVVPNRNVETYVKLGVARALGIAANIETRLLRGFLAQVARDSFSDVEIVDRARIQGELLGLLHDDRLLAATELRPILDYIGAAGTGRDAVDLRRCQLSAELAALFDDYTFSRPEMLAAWGEGRLTEGPELATQLWQRELWRAIFSAGGSLEVRTAADHKQRRTLAQVLDGVDPSVLRLPPAVHVFGISYVARLYKAIFGTLAQSTALHIYTLNPCREFWEDLETGGRRSRTTDRRKFPPRRAQEQLSLGEAFGPAPGPGANASAAGEAGAEAADENPLLTLWGRPGRDNIKLLNQLADCDFDGRFVDPLAHGKTSPPTVLQQLQHDILDRLPGRGGPARLSLDDDSVTVMACPDSRREFETIAATIWSLVRRDDEERAKVGDGGGDGGGGAGDARPPPLRFSDIAVIVAGASGPGGEVGARLNLASAVFREASELPHAVVDLPLAAESRLVEALELLLALPLGPLRRQELLRLVMHPAVARRFPGADPVFWLRLTEELGIVSGADHDDQRGTYLDRDLFNWDQGLKRVALGAFLTGRRGGQERPFALGQHQYLAADLPPDTLSSALDFGSVVRGLIADARLAAGTQQPLRAWMSFLRGAITRTLMADGPDEQAVLARCLAELAPLEELGPPNLRVGYRVACELVRSALAGLGGRRGQYLADGVTLSSFLPMRAIPFRVIFVAGLGEREFPATDRNRPLDLRGTTRRQGDVTAREQDQYMFLEALLCARERFYCSYVARDPLTGETRAPSSTLLDLIDTIERGYAAPPADGGAPAVPTRRPPLRRHEDGDVRAVFPAAAREFRAEALGRDLRQNAGGGLPALGDLRRTLPAGVWQATAAALGWLPPPRPAPTGGDPTATLVVSTAQLRRFLECPMQGSAEALLSLRTGDDDAEAATREDEAFHSPRVRALPFLREVFVAALSGDEPPDDAGLARAYDQLAAVKTLDGTLPAGPFGEVTREQHLTLLNGWRAALLRMTGSLPRPYRLWFGHADEHVAAPEILPAVTLELTLTPGPAVGTAPAAEPRRVRVAIHGRSQALADIDGQRTALMLATHPTGDTHRNERELLRAFLDHVVLSAGGHAGGQGVRAVICRPDPRRDRPPHQVQFLPMAEAEARRYLETVVGDMLGGVFPYLLPIEAVISARIADRPIPNVVALWRDDTFMSIQSDHGPVPEPRSYPAPPDDVARALIDRRFGPFFQLRREAAAAGEGEGD